MGAKRILKRGAFKKHGKSEFDTLFIRFQPRREVQKNSLFGSFFGASLVKKAGPEKDTSKTHLWKLTWPPGGTQCDFWVPNGVPIGIQNL